MSNGLRQEDPLRRLLEKDAVISTLNHLFRAVDEKDWAQAEACLAPDVLLDLTSLAGGEPESTSGAAIVDGWREGLAH
ncbi:MAG: nuclear transport factor 2 family protein, partial [Gemmatimonadetes bacterium]|nr:nuclear transport factor 2 family protein [Gemmatimonadota bacterium]